MKPKKIFIAWLIILITSTIAGCGGTTHPFAELKSIEIPFGTPEASAQPLPALNDTITIASFNIQVFGKSKAGKPEVMDTIVEIISQFDIVAIQEIRDASGTAIVKLENLMDATGTDYNYIIGPRLGRTSSKEQYAYVYRTDRIEVETATAYTYEEPAGVDKIHREPYIARFKVKNGNFDFVLVTSHTDPDDATQEINKLPDVVKDAQQKFPDEKDFIVLGDLNSDCKKGTAYFDEDDMASPLRAAEFLWIITNDMDTNLASSSCTYDRIIITSSTTSEDWTFMAGVYHFDTIHSLTYDQAKKVSDHYPVWAVFHTHKDSD